MFHSLLSTFVSALRPRGDDDFVDRLNYFYTPLMLMGAAILTSLNQYVKQPLQCWLVTFFKWLPEGWTHNMEQYIESYCWVQDTYFLPIQEHIPDDMISREKRQIPYYQWVPFILMMEAMMFTFPCVVWRLLNWQTGVNLSQVVGAALDINTTDVTLRSRIVRAAGRAVQDTLDLQAGLTFDPQSDGTCPDEDEGEGGYDVQHKDDTETPPVAQPDSMGQSVFAQQANQSKYFLKYNGSYLTALYLVIKVFFFVNILLQLLMLNLLLQGQLFPFYGYLVIKDLLQGRQWKQSGHFPRVTLCDFEVRTLGNINRYTVQCTLPINLFNEKVFIFFWIWLSLLAAITISSLLFWTVQSISRTQRRDFVIRYLYVAAAHSQRTLKTSDPASPPELSLYMVRTSTYHRFIDHYLRFDGIFILRMLSNHVGDVPTLEIVKHLWKEFIVRCRAASARQRLMLISASKSDDSLLARMRTQSVQHHRFAKCSQDSPSSCFVTPKSSARPNLTVSWPITEDCPTGNREPFIDA